VKPVRAQLLKRTSSEKWQKEEKKTGEKKQPWSSKASGEKTKSSHCEENTTKRKGIPVKSNGCAKAHGKWTLGKLGRRNEGPEIHVIRTNLCKEGKKSLEKKKKGSSDECINREAQKLREIALT